MHRCIRCTDATISLSIATMLRRSLGGLPSLCALASSGAKLLHASPVPAQLPRALPAPVDDRRKGPRLGYRRRPLQRCVLVLSLAVLSAAAPASAQQQHNAAKPAREDDDRKGPRLEYKQGPAECLREELFRSVVASAAHDGIDHLHDDSPDVVRVWFEKIRGGYRGTVEYTDATGAKDVPEVLTSYNCELLAYSVASTVSDTIPRPPPPPPCPAPTCAACPACAVCGTPQPVPCPIPPKPPPWRMDLSVGLNTYVMMTAFLSANVGPAVGIAGEVRGEVFGVTGEFRFVLPSRAYAVEPVPGATSSYPQEFDVSQLSALIVPCARYEYFLGCGVAQLGGLLVQTPVTYFSRFSFAVGPRLGFEVPFAEKRFAVFGFGEVLFFPARQGIDFTLPDPNKPEAPPANTRWLQSLASGFFGAGFSVRFR